MNDASRQGWHARKGHVWGGFDQTRPALKLSQPNPSFISKNLNLAR